jgi:uncharacterized membrane protein YphA (DoxX/SURF4 family)
MTFSRAAVYAHAALRTVTGFLFLQHGYPKLFGTLPGSSEVEAPVELLSIFWWSGFLEVVGGTLIMIGLLTRPVAFVVAGEMAVAYVWRHAQETGGPAATAASLRHCTASSSSIWRRRARGRGAWTVCWVAGPSCLES